MQLPIRTTALALVTAFALSGAAPVSSTEVDAARAVAVGAFFAVQEAFVLPPGEHVVVVSQASPGMIATMRGRIRTVLARYYADPLYSKLVQRLDENYDCGNCAPFVGGFGADSVQWEPFAFDRSNAVIGGRLFGWVSNGTDGHTLPVGSWFRYAMTRTPAGWRVVDAMEGFLPGYGP